MKNKPWKVITKENGEVRIFKQAEDVPLEYGIPEWNEESGEEELFFKYREDNYFLSDFVNVHNEVWSPNPPEWLKEFEGVHNYSYDSGLLINIHDGEAVDIYYFYYSSIMEGGNK